MTGKRPEPEQFPDDTTLNVLRKQRNETRQLVRTGQQRMAWLNKLIKNRLRLLRTLEGDKT